MSDLIEADRLFMGRALELARRGLGRTSPNPMVGAVLVKNGTIIGEGFHERVGAAHAEIAALQDAREAVAGATMYVNLEPCCHQGRTPPCAPELVRAGVHEVVVGLVDPFHKVSGQGIQQLREAGVSVRMLEDRTLTEECARLNRVFLKHARTGLPFVTMKYAMTLDGKIATRSGHSQWISSEPSRLVVHEQRTLNDAVMVGIGTALADNPRLTARGTTGRDPVKIIVDSTARLPLDARVLVEAPGRVIVATTAAAPAERVRTLQSRGVQIMECPTRDGKVDLTYLMRRLAREQITSVLLEGGGTLMAGMVFAGLVDRVMAFVAPVLVGGAQAMTPLEGTGVPTMADGLRLEDVYWQTCGTDILVTGTLPGAGDRRD